MKILAEADDQEVVREVQVRNMFFFFFNFSFNDYAINNLSRGILNFDPLNNLENKLTQGAVKYKNLRIWDYSTFFYE